MGLFTLPVSLFLCGMIVLVEMLRRKQGSGLDFLLPVNVLFLVAFGLVPLFLVFGIPDEKGWTDFVAEHSFESPIFLLASLTSICGYAALIFGYFFKDVVDKGLFIESSKRNCMTRTKKHGSKKEEGYLLTAAIVLASIGIASFAVYTYSIGGVSVMIEKAPVFRGSSTSIITPYAFLKNLAPLVIVSSYFFFALRQMAYKKPVYYLSTFLFGLTFFISLILLWHQSARLDLIAYLLIFPTVKVIQAGRLSLMYVMGGTFLFIFFILFGKEIFHYFIDPQAYSVSLTNILANPMAGVTDIVLEFSFPYITLANAINVVPGEVMYRWFVDIPIAVVHLLPDRLLSITPPQTVNMINVEQLNGPIPVDLVSFGYYSLGISGVLIVCFSFGLLLRIFDRLLPENSNAIVVVFRTAWIMFLGFHVMYGNPYHAVIEGFALFAGTAALLLCLRKGSANPSPRYAVIASTSAT